MNNLKGIAIRYGGSQNKKELETLFYLMADLNPAVVVEIGIDRALTTQAMRNAFDPSVLIGIDTEDKRQFEGFTFIQGDSKEQSTINKVKELIGKHKIDVLFIDGDHTKGGVENDFLNYKPMVRDGGMIVFHDINVKGNGGVEVREVWDRIVKEYQFPSYMEILASNGMGIGVIYK